MLKKIKNFFIRITPSKRKIIQLYAALLYNANIKGYLTGNHKYAREMFREKLRALEEQGMTKLVIDLRGNGGGFGSGCTHKPALRKCR